MEVPGSKALVRSISEDVVPIFSDEVKPARLPCHLIRDCVQDGVFYGRHEILQTLHRELVPCATDGSREDVKAIQVCGPGGIGKTHFASEFVRTAKRKFDAVFWIQAEDAQKLSEAFANIATELGLVDVDSPESRDEGVTKQAVLDWLASPAKAARNSKAREEWANWLMVFDNVVNPSIVDEYWPRSSRGNGSILLTAREECDFTHKHHLGKVIELDSFEADDATEMLLRIIGRETDENARVMCSQIALRLGGYPLAVIQIGGILKRRNLSAEDFSQAFDSNLQHEALDLASSNSEGESPQQRIMLDNIWALKTLSDGAALLLDVISLLDPDGIPEVIFERHLPAIKVPEYPKAEASYQLAKRELLQSSLVARNGTTGNLTVHRLIQLRARAHMDKTRFGIVFNLAVQLLRAFWPFERFGFGHDNASWGVCTKIFTHVMRLQRYSEHQQPEEYVTETSLEFPHLLGAAGRFNHQRGRSMESLEYFEKVLAICEDLEERVGRQRDARSGELMKKLYTLTAQTNYDIGCVASETNQPALALQQFEELREKVQRATAETHYDIGCIASEINKPQLALRRFQAFNIMVKSIIRGVKQRTDKTLAVSWNELGVANMMNENWSEGEACFLVSLEELKYLDTYTPIDGSFPLINLGFSFWLQGRLEEAKDVLSQILHVRERELGTDDKTGFLTGKLLHACGNVEASLGNMDRAFDFHKRALIQYTITIGTNHHRTGDLCVKVSDHYVRLQQHEHALSLLQQALKTYGDKPYYRPEKARALYKKGMILRECMAPLSTSQECLDEALRLYRGLENPSVDVRKGIDELDVRAFDRVVVFWSK